MYHNLIARSRVSTHMEPIDKMDKRSDSLKSSRQSTSRRSKRRSDHKDVSLNTWDDNRQNGSMNYLRDPLTGIRLPSRMLLQTRVAQADSQRLHSALSDPGVCGYSPVSLTYTMQPVSLPPVYGLYPPSVHMPFPEVGTFTDMLKRDLCNTQVKVRPDNANSNVANNCDNQRENDLDLPIRIPQRNGDYASLPPAAESGINSDELNAEHRRYSDPGLGPANTTTDSDSECSIESVSSNTTTIRYNKLLLTLVEQISDLKRYNSDLFKKLNETKRYVENLTAESAQCKHASSDYQPGMLSDTVREIRTANKKCEEGLITKVQTMMDEMRNQREKEMEEFKNQISILRKEKDESEKRVANLEAELAAMKLSITNGGREIAAFEEETLALRRELQEARASRNMAENHAAKLEKLVEILRKKVNGATAVSRIRDVLTTGACAVPTGTIKRPMHCALSSTSSSEDESDENDDHMDDDDDADGESPEGVPRNDKDPLDTCNIKAPSTIDNNINLSGPVTDL